MRGEACQILLLDNGSRDGSVEYLREVSPQVQVIANSRNLGFAAGCNLGMGQALDEDFEYVILVNNDTAVDPGLLAQLVAEARHPRLEWSRRRFTALNLPIEIGGRMVPITRGLEFRSTSDGGKLTPGRRRKPAS